MPRIRLASTAVALAAAALALHPGSPVAQGPYPACDPAIAAHPTFGSSGSPEADLNDARLFATHPVTVAVGLPHTEGSQLIGDVAIQPPAGLAPITNEDVMTGAGMDTFDGLTDAKTFVSDAAGALPIRATWNQFDENGNNPCSAEATTSVTLASPIARLKLSRPKDTRGLGGDESRITLAIPRAGVDLRPLEIRYRAVRGQRFPGAGAKRRTFAVAMRASDPGFRRNREAKVKVGGLEARFEPENGDAVLMRYSVLFLIRSAGGTNYGYDLDVHQGGRSVTRLRVAGNCHRIGGSIECKRKKVARTP